MIGWLIALIATRQPKLEPQRIGFGGHEHSSQQWWSGIWQENNQSKLETATDEVSVNWAVNAEKDDWMSSRNQWK